ncbi:hypothetical protein NLI96_g7635 [Meripilus lineatus]|uniref:Uncharacterized protein n=1 Tax=Meripilus lineatus TaxID=2056292 RepID=A0AAD5YCS2_9APHY|nr:hypothetical protein NLI96_g7635 [Physisporinus lineatus]
MPLSHQDIAREGRKTYRGPKATTPSLPSEFCHHLPSRTHGNPQAKRRRSFDSTSNEIAREPRGSQHKGFADFPTGDKTLPKNSAFK